MRAAVPFAETQPAAVPDPLCAAALQGIASAQRVGLSVVALVGPTTSYCCSSWLEMSNYGVP